MNNTQEKTYTAEQNHLIAELSATYGIEPEEIIFFTGEPRPLFSYEATAVLCNRLTDLRGIDVEPVNNGFVDSVSYRCTLTQADGCSRSAVGVANVDEKDGGGQPLKSSQLVELASGRAIRNALRVAGIDLLKLHNQSRNTLAGFSGPAVSNYQSLQRLVHVLGQEAGLIIGDDKSAWKKILTNRYGFTSSSDLSEDQLADLVGVLQTLVPQTRQKAA